MKYNFNMLPQELAAGTNALLEQLNMESSESGIIISVCAGDKLTLSRSGNTVTIGYSRKCEYFRALSMLNSFVEKEKEVEQQAEYTMLCYMADMSRNAVYNMTSAKQMIRYLALCGYDSLMLYTEDTFEMPEYPYFGYMRGRFSESELKEIDDYAFMLGIEVIPCIQTLGHLTMALRWGTFAPLRDNTDILLAGNDKTYDFIRNMVVECKKCFRSRKINVGMDEAYSLGLGRYLKLNGYVNSTEIMIKHLEKVVEICTEEGCHPMIWSDMFFRMQFGRYRVSEGEISPETIANVPENLTLIYWDYYSLDRKMFSHMVDCHMKFNNPVAFAGGAWKWSGFAPHNRFSLKSTELQLDCCKEAGLKQVIVTAWGDNGAEASQFSILPSMLYFSERCYCNECNSEHMEKRSRECFDIGYEEMLTVDAPNELDGIVLNREEPSNPCKYLLYNDPLMGLFDRQMDAETAAASFARSCTRLEALAGQKHFGYMFDTLAKLCAVLELKCDLTVRMRNAYKSGDINALSVIAEKDIPVIILRLDRFLDAFRVQWFKENKTYGFDIQELRIGGLKERLKSTADRIKEYVNGNALTIDELEQNNLWFDCRSSEYKGSPYFNYNQWNKNCSPSVV